MDKHVLSHSRLGLTSGRMSQMRIFPVQYPRSDSTLLAKTPNRFVGTVRDFSLAVNLLFVCGRAHIDFPSASGFFIILLTGARLMM